jgi:UDP-2,3-diacylglucosamine pyrophosphatase LpxH
MRTQNATLASPVLKLRFRTIWISDVHLGTNGCNADLLLNFLKSTDSETLYLVGDIIDGWRLKRNWYWPDAHNDVIRKLLKKAKRGTRVIYIPGNHDEGARQFVNLNFGGVQLLHDVIHETADGRKLWVLHGDAFDGVVLYARWLAFLGDYAYALLLSLNTWFNVIRRKMGFDYWSLSAFLKKKVKNAVEYVGRFEEAVSHAALERGVDGVICGHIHSAEIRPMGKLTYYNDGDWVESCTALVEHFDGRMEILHWADMVRSRASAISILQPQERERMPA